MSAGSRLLVNRADHLALLNVDESAQALLRQRIYRNAASLRADGTDRQPAQGYAPIGIAGGGPRLKR